MNQKPLSIQVRLAWPERALSPHVQCHHLTLHKAKKRAKGRARMSTLAALKNITRRTWLSDNNTKIHFTVVAVPACNRGQDDDSLVASLSDSLTGVAEALCVNDNRFECKGVTFLPPDPLDFYIFLTFTPEQKS